MKQFEQRREPRHRGKLPVKLESGKGITRDFSGSGIFFETDRSFSPGQHIEFTLILEYIAPDNPVSLKCLGEIIRVEKRDQNIGVAAAIDSYAFEGFNQMIQPEALTEYTRNEAAKKKTKKNTCKYEG